jgi:hypothetical protein
MRKPDANASRSQSQQKMKGIHRLWFCFASRSKILAQNDRLESSETSAAEAGILRR